MKKVIPCNNCIYLAKERSEESAKIHGQVYHCEYWDDSRVDEDDGCTKGKWKNISRTISENEVEE